MSAPLTPDQTRALDRSLVRGVAWTGVSRWITQLFNWGATILVARILTPEDYGVVGMAMVYIGMTALITEFGLGSAVVALKHISRDEVAQLNTLAVMLGGVGVGLSLGAAVPIGWFFRTPAVAPVIMALSLTLLIDSARSIPAAVLAKDMRFKFLAIVDIIKALTVSALTVTLAVAGFGYWALVVGTVISSAFPTMLILFRHPMPFRRPRRHQLTEAIHYIKNFLVGNLSWYAYTNADFVVAGRVLGKAPLGDYTVAWTLASAPIERIAGLINRVLPPLYSAVRDDKVAMRRYLLKITQGLSVIVVPAATGLSLVARDLVVSLLGDKWAGTVTPLRILAFYALLQTLQLVVPPVLMVTGNIRTAARIGFVSALVLPAAFIIGGITHQTTGIALVWITVYPVVLCAMYRAAFRVIDLNARDYLRAIRPALISSACMAAAVLTLSAAPGDIAALWLLFAKVTLGAGVYAAVLSVFWRKQLLDMFDAIRLLGKG